MKTVLKRVTGLVLVLAMVVGALYGIKAPVVNAESESTNTGVNVGTIVTGGTTTLAANTSNETTWSYRYRDRKFSLDLNVANQVENYANDLQLYLKVGFTNQAAATALSGCYVELGNNNTTNDTEELQWSLSGLSITYDDNNPTYEVYLKFAAANQNNTGFSCEEMLQHFQIYSPKDNENMTDAAGISVMEVKIISTAPVVIAKYADAVAEAAPEGKYDADYYAFSGWYSDATASATPYTGTTAGEAYARFVTKDVLGLKSQYELETVSDDEMLVLANCDAGTTVTNNITYTMRAAGSTSYVNVESGASNFVEGTGALSYTGIDENFANVKTNSGTFNISGYETGKLHFWLKIKDDNQGIKTTAKIIVRVSNRDNYRNRVEWQIPISDLTLGAWTEFNLNFYDATLYQEGESSGIEVHSFSELSSLDMDRVHFYFDDTPSQSYTAYIDDIRLVKGFDGKIFDECDTNSEKTQMGYLPTPTTIEGAQGGVAYPLKDEQVGAHYRLTNKTVDASSYVEGGYLHLMLYNATDWSSSTDKLVVELGSTCERYSSGSDGRACVRFTMDLKDLKMGWNELDFDLSSPSFRSETLDDNGDYSNTTRPAIEWTSLLRMKVSTQNDAKMGGMYLDDIRIISKAETSHDMGGTVSRKASLRFITSVDSLNYQNAGFDIKVGSQANATSYVSTSVLENLLALGASEEYTANNLFVSQSKYFSTRKITNIPESALGTTITVTPRWTTQDGTKVTGITRTGTIMQWIYGTTNVAE